MPQLENVGDIHITALRGKTVTPGDPVSLDVGTTTVNQTIFPTGLIEGTFELKQIELWLRGNKIPYIYTSLDGANVVYDSNYVAIGQTQDGDYYELKIIL